MEYIVPAVVILVGNLFSGPHGSRQWERITALFGWAAVIAFTLWLIASVLSLFGMGTRIAEFFVPVWVLCLLQAVSRDYERMLNPIVDRLTKYRNQSE